MTYRYKFTVGKHKPEAEWKREGKSEWPNMLDVEMTNFEALRILRELANQIGNESTVTLTLVGELEPNEDE